MAVVVRTLAQQVFMIAAEWVNWEELDLMCDSLFIFRVTRLVVFTNNFKEFLY